MERIGILGSTGTIGRKVLELIKDNSADFELTFITCNSNISLLQQQIAYYNPKYAIVTGDINSKLEGNILNGWQHILDIIENKKIDLLFVASSGVDCIHAIYIAILKGLKIATVNKETIVIAGDILCPLAKDRNVQFIPVDSEHSGIFQCLMGQNIDTIRSIILTASGGPFLYKQRKELENITLEDALDHPVWKMGKKITIDSATMMNKAFELIETHYLFNIPSHKLDTIIHPQSIIHAIVSFIDGSSLAQLSIPDMKIPISFALYYPQRNDLKNYYLDLPRVKNLTFMEMDNNRFPLIKTTKELLTGECNSYIIALEIANEIAVKSFLNKQIGFTAIELIIKKILDTIKPLKLSTINDILSYRNEIAIKTINLIKGM